MMDQSMPPEVVQTSEVDTEMQDSDQTDSKSHLPNGFMDPQVLNRMHDLDLPNSSTEGVSQESSEPSEEVPEAAPRRSLLPTGCCYDARMKMHANADFSNSAHHPEDPRRIEAIFQEFRLAGLVYNGSDADLAVTLKDFPNRWMWRIAAREATATEICTVHTAAHLEWVKNLNNLTGPELRDMTANMDSGRKSLYVGNLSYEAALVSAGGAIEICKNVVAGNVKNAIAVIRPPGHHAEHNEAMGFCFFNNVPIAAKVCMADYPEVCRKILILDWDVHHGNGIQNMFYEDPNVLYISIHVYQNGSFYPGQPEDDGTPDGGNDKCGAGLGMGKNVNIGWHDQGMGDGEYMAAFQRVVMPIAQEFDPDFVIISAGFDAAAGDELGGCFVTPECYSHMTHMLMSLANGKVAVCLEGGYNLRAISRSALAVAKTLMGEPPMKMKIPPLNYSASFVLNQVKTCQAPFWQCMREGVVMKDELRTIDAERLQETLRYAQRQRLWEAYKMTPYRIEREKLSVCFENMVLSTPQLCNAKKIMLIIHDPPDVLAAPDPVNGKLFARSTATTDAVRKYIDWAIAIGFGVLDVSIPSYITDPNDKALLQPKMNEAEINNQTKDLLCYLWDNYLEPLGDGPQIVLLGAGEAYIGVKQLLTSRDCSSKIPCIVSFVSGSLRPVKSETDGELSAWYRAHSLIYVAPDHSIWTDQAAARKVKKKRFGDVKMSTVIGLNAMMDRYFDDVTAFVKGKVEEAEMVRARGMKKGGDETEVEVDDDVDDLA